LSGVLKHRSRKFQSMDRDDVADVSLHKNLAGLRTVERSDLLLSMSTPIQRTNRVLLDARAL